MNTFGVHDLSDRAANLGVQWLVDAVAIGHDGTHTGGADYTHWTDKGCTIICRLNNDWHPGGTIPQPAFYEGFAQRCANFVQASTGCHIWVIGNEWNLSIERPYGRIITADQYISCYNGVREAIKAVAPDDWVVPAAIGPWNIESGDWLELYQAVLQCVEADAICWHVYSHGYDPVLVASEQTMDPPYENRRYHFRAYKDFEIWTPEEKRTLPVLVTEANGNGPWQATGWIPAAYNEIQNSTMDVCCMCLFRAQQTSDGYGLTEGAWTELEQAMSSENGGDDVAGWQDVYVNRCEQGFFPQGTDHLLVAKGLTVHYLHGGEGHFPRPELKPKDAELGQPEVYPDGGRFSQSGFYISADGRFGLVTDPVYVSPEKRTRGSVMYMHAYGMPFGLGARCGIIDGDGPFTGGPVWSLGGIDPFASTAITWGDWRWARQDDVNLTPRTWAKLSTPEISPSGDYVRLVTQFNADVAGPGSNGHWDLFRIEQYLEGETPPETPTECHGATPEEVRQIIREELGNLRVVLE